jgi:formate dehydrogenase subunit gamma
MATLINRTAPDLPALEICQRHGNRPELLIEVLHDVQGKSGRVSDGAISTIANALNLSRAEVLGVVTFYDDFRRENSRGLEVRICHAEACQAGGADDLIAWAQDHLVTQHNIELGHVYCLGNCALGPSALVGGTLLGRLSATKLAAACAARASDIDG